MIEKDIKKKVDFLINLLYYTLIFIASFLTLKYVLPFLAPFVFGFFIAFIFRPVSKLVSKKTKINNKFCDILIILLAYCIIVLLIFIIGFKIIAALKNIANSSTQLYKTLLEPIKNLVEKYTTTFLDSFFENSENSSKDILEQITDNLNYFIISNSKHILTAIAKFGSSLPKFLVDLAFALISSIYFSYDYEKIAKFITKIFPEKTKHFLFETKRFALNSIIKYIKAYFLLSLISFVLISIGFLFIKIKNPIGSAALISLFDSIPIVGSGVIFIPWALSLFLTKNFHIAISLLVVFAFSTIIRSFLEPKVLGKNLDISSLAALITIYVGAKLFGFVGIIFAPVCANIVFSFFKLQKKSTTKETTPKNFNTHSASKFHT